MGIHRSLKKKVTMTEILKKKKIVNFQFAEIAQNNDRKWVGLKTFQLSSSYLW